LSAAEPGTWLTPGYETYPRSAGSCGNEGVEMGLADLMIPERIAPAEPGAESMSLPQAMNALERGELELPPELPDALGKLMPPTSSLPKQKPQPDPLAEFAAEQERQNREDRMEMAVRIRARQMASPSEHMQLAEQQLREMESRK